MATTADYLAQLQADKQALVDNLIDKHIEATNDETFTTLAKKVKKISTGELVDFMTTTDMVISGAKMGWRVYSEKDYTDSEIAKVQKLLDMLGGGE